MVSNFAVTTPASTPPLTLGAETTDIGFPWAGAALLLLLAAVAVAVRWRRQREVGGMPADLAQWLKRPAQAAGDAASLKVESSTRLDAQTRLHAVRWGDRLLLVGTGPNASPVLLDSRSPADGKSTP